MSRWIYAIPNTDELMEFTGGFRALRKVLGRKVKLTRLFKVW